MRRTSDGAFLLLSTSVSTGKLVTVRQKSSSLHLVSACWTQCQGGDDPLLHYILPRMLGARF